ncbi:MAG: hypothetical protein HPY83_08130 [Anaerolineae bacterium]|nr:hypothetical protein [Anaerolineae bacterium]
MPSVIERLLQSDDPAVRVKTQVLVLGADPYSWDSMVKRREIVSSPRVQALLSERDEEGRIPHHPYRKWYGAHWVLAQLADLGYPPGDDSLLPLRDQVYEWLFSERHEKSIKEINGRVRRCASQEGNALYYLLALGLADSRTEELAQRLMKWQWHDGGWNCDKRPEATNSSFMETLIPLRGLAWHSKLTGSGKPMQSALRAANIFLKRRLFRRQSDGSVISPGFVQLHYPCYWHYDILFGLKVLAEAGLIRDRRCDEALDLLQSKQLEDGGFPAEAKYYTVSESNQSGSSRADWGGADKRRMNEFVTADALYVLRAAGRYRPPLAQVD